MFTRNIFLALNNMLLQDKRMHIYNVIYYIISVMREKWWI